MTYIIHSLTPTIQEDMLALGWRTNGVYWWIDSEPPMDWKDARDLHKETCRDRPAQG